MQLPADFKPKTEYPVIYWYHGWGDDPTWTAFENSTEAISVYPLGMDDQEGVKPGEGLISWNLGDANRTNTCSPQTKTVCYKSCKKLNKCSVCNCVTCYDDVFFTKTLIKKIEEDYCIDTSRLYISGASNGGMFSYYLASQIPEAVNGYLLMFGQPFVSWLNTPKRAAESYLLSLHGRSDTCLPPGGGIDDDESWIYESLDSTFYVWGLVQGCDMSSWERVKTPFDNVKNNLNLVCHEYTRGCRTGRSLSCMYDGQHGDIPDYMQDLTWWFWNTRYSSNEDLYEKFI